MAIVVDTNIVSYIFKNDTRGESYKSHFTEVPKFISFVTLAELRRWQLQSNWGKSKNERFEELLSDFGVIHSDAVLCNWWAKITNESFKRGNPLSPSDDWIAATALMFDIPLVTHNRKHFDNITGLKIISEN